MSDMMANVAAQIAKSVNSHSGKESDRRIIAIRWMNRLYYDLSAVRQEVLGILDAHPIASGKMDSESIQEFAEELDEWRRRNMLSSIGSRYQEVCARIEMLFARIPIDFNWMKQADPSMYSELMVMTGRVRHIPNFNRSVSEALISDARYGLFSLAEELKSKKIGRRGAAGRLKNIRDKYSRDSQESIDKIGELIANLSGKLLTIEEYEAAMAEAGSSDPKVLILGEVTMGDRHQYNVGQAGAVGPNATVHQANLTQGSAAVGGGFDVSALASELEALRLAMKSGGVTDADADIDIGVISQAQRAATSGDLKGTIAALAGAGKWALGVAEKIGVQVAGAAIKQAAGY